MDGSFLKKKILSTGFQLHEVAKKLEISQQDLQSKLKRNKIANAVNKDIYFFFDEIVNNTNKNGGDINNVSIQKGGNANVGSNNKNSQTEKDISMIKNIADDRKELIEILKTAQEQQNKLIEQLSGKDKQVDKLLEQQNKLIDQLSGKR